MKTADIDLSKMLEFRPHEGKLLLGVERMLIFRQHAMSVLRGLMYTQLGDELSRALLSQFGYQCGRGDYYNLLRSYEWESERDTLTSGPVLHTWEGLVHAAPSTVEYDRETGRYYMVGEWTNSYEAEIHLEELGESAVAACHSLTGYASGWSSAFFGKECVAIEPTCVARGDDKCRFEIRDVDSWDERADPWRKALESTTTSLVRELEQLNSRQQHTISTLSTPLMEIWDDILVLPIVGAIDAARGLDIMDKLLRAVAESRARAVILDVTGVEEVDAHTASELLDVVQAASLLGAHCVVTGVSASVARLMVEIGADLSGVKTLKNLKQGLRECIRLLED